KAARVLLYYARLVRYGWTSDAQVFHILWNNKFEIADRVLLMALYRLTGRRVVLTAHNVNARKRDGHDTLLNRLTLRVQYALSHHIFVHTARMKSELVADFGVRRDRVTVIPFGINNAVPNGPLTPPEARRRLGQANGEKAILFFGNIAPYKGLDSLVDAFATLSARRHDVRLIVAGKPRQGCESYWRVLRHRLGQGAGAARVIERTEYIPD